MCQAKMHYGMDILGLPAVLLRGRIQSYMGKLFIKVGERDSLTCGMGQRAAHVLGQNVQITCAYEHMHTHMHCTAVQRVYAGSGSVWASAPAAYTPGAGQVPVLPIGVRCCKVPPFDTLMSRSIHP